MSTPYHDFVNSYVGLRESAARQPLGGFPPAPRPEIAPDAPKVLIFSPHPDDECIIGGIALRLLREQKMNVINVAVTQGSRKDRQAARFEELTNACNYIGFGLIQTKENGLEEIKPATIQKDPALWAESVEIIARILEEHRPRIILLPHEDDWNGTHIGTHYLVRDALKKLGPDFSCYVVETEFWHAMGTPNLMVEVSAGDLGDLVAALSFHVEEVRRNPYHVTLPAWMADNVRRGGEVVGGQGAAAPDYDFATLYRLCRWENGELKLAYEGGRQIGTGDDLGQLFA